MSEMVERVARAIDDACPCDMTVCMGPDAARTMAAAAIAAMREPTQAMCEAGDIIPPAPGEIAWPRMIDAALESVEAA